MSNILATQEPEKVAVEVEEPVWSGAPAYNWGTGGKEMDKVQFGDLEGAEVNHNFFRMARWLV